MQTWQTPLVTLKSDSSDVTQGTLDLECSEVVIETSTVATAGNSAPAAGDRLKVKNVDASDIAVIDWTPSVVSFSAVGAVEPQQFSVSAMQVDQAGRAVVFTLG